MFRFEDPIYLWLLLLIPVFAGIRYLSLWQRRRKLRIFGEAELLRTLMPNASKFRPAVKFWLLMAVLALLIVILARPQMGAKISREKRNGIETMICLDISNSMLSRDVAPSRLDKSKMLVENLVDKFNNDKIGLIVFAGEAFVQLPITSDYVSAKMFLQNIEPDLIQSQGTNIGEALNVAMNSFTQQEKIGRAIIVITDGEDHEGRAVEMAKAARKKGINVFILGIGSTNGAPIPVSGGGYLTDNRGETVMSALNEEMCKEIAKAGSGTYIHVDNTSDAQEKLNNELTRLQKGETESVIYSEYDEQFQAVGIILILLLVIEVCVSERKAYLSGRYSALFRRKGSQRNNKVLLTLGLIVLLNVMGILAANAQDDRTCIRMGNRLFHAQEWEKAEVMYRKALAQNDRNTQAMYNLGCALMAQQKDSAAALQFEQAAKAEQNKIRRAKSWHNMGVICQQHQQYSEAIKAYEHSLRCNPHDNETRYNLALCKRLQKNQPQQNQDNQQNQNNQNKKEDQKKENQEKEKQQQDKKNNQQQQQPQQEKMSKENAEQLLNAAIQEEKATKQRLDKAMQKPQRNKYQKNW